jgi:hypothetical protein
MHLDAFHAWCQAKSIQSSLQIRESDSGFRYTTLQDNVVLPATSNPSTLLRIPLVACITATDSESLVDRLAFEKRLGAASDFAPYIDTMPSLESFQMPRFWSSQRLESVRDGGQLERELETDRLRYRQDPWSLACVDSRCHFLPNGGYSLTPVLDMINHNPTVKTSLRSERMGDEDALCLDVSGQSVVFNDQPATSMVPSSWLDRLFQTRTPTDPIRSKEVNISYGDFSNIHTLLNYGFVFPGNPSNCESLVVRLIRMQSPVVLVVNSDGSIEDDGLGRLRRAIASTEERELIEFLPDNQKNPLLFVSKRNEEEVLALVAGELEVAMEQSCDGAHLAKDDWLVALYLDERTQTLRRALNRIQNTIVA